MKTENEQLSDAALSGMLEAYARTGTHAEFRHEAVWERVATGLVHARLTRRRGRRVLWGSVGVAAAAAVLVLASLRQIPSTRAERVAAADEATIVAAGRLLRSIDRAGDSEEEADSLRQQGTLLLASTRALMDEHRYVGKLSPVLSDLELALAQVVEGGLSDPVERALTIQTIRSRELVERTLGRRGIS